MGTSPQALARNPGGVEEAAAGVALKSAPVAAKGLQQDFSEGDMHP